MRVKVQAENPLKLRTWFVVDCTNPMHTEIRTLTLSIINSFELEMLDGILWIDGFSLPQNGRTEQLIRENDIITITAKQKTEDQNQTAPVSIAESLKVNEELQNHIKLLLEESKLKRQQNTEFTENKKIRLEEEASEKSSASSSESSDSSSTDSDSDSDSDQSSETSSESGESDSSVSEISTNQKIAIPSGLNKSKRKVVEKMKQETGTHILFQDGKTRKYPEVTFSRVDLKNPPGTYKNTMQSRQPSEINSNSVIKEGFGDFIAQSNDWQEENMDELFENEEDHVDDDYDMDAAEDQELQTLEVDEKNQTQPEGFKSARKLIDYEKLEPVSYPSVGMKIAFKALYLSESIYPAISNYKEGIITAVEAVGRYKKTVSVKVIPTEFGKEIGVKDTSGANITNDYKTKGKFDEDVDELELDAEGILTDDWNNFLSPRLLSGN